MSNVLRSSYIPNLFFWASSLILSAKAFLFSVLRRRMSSLSWSTSCWSRLDKVASKSFNIFFVSVDGIHEKMKHEKEKWRGRMRNKKGYEIYRKWAM